MRIIKRWMALMITISLAVSDCGSITVFATEGDIAAETLDAGDDEEHSQEDEEENAASDEMPDDDEIISQDETEKGENTDVSSEDVDEDETHEETDSEQAEDAASETDPEQDEDTMPETDSEQDEDTASETDAKAELPFLHIGQINAGDELPSPDDHEFVYDLPISFEISDSVLLFVYHNMDTIPEKEEGTLVWSILRGENGMEEGSVCLVDEEDDWADFEVVTDSPYFTMTENTDEESDYYQTVELIAEDVVADEETEETEDHKDYNYYIRAAYYFEADEELNEEFYAAVTLPFCPNEDTNTDEAQDDASDAEEIDVDEIQEDDSVTEETDEEEMPDDALLEEVYGDTASEGIDVNPDGTAEEFESDQQDLVEPTEKLMLDFAGDEEDKDKPMRIGETRQITVRIESKEAPADPQEEQEDTQEETTVESSEIVWESSDKNVATVDNGSVHAEAEGYAWISAEYKGLTSSIKVEVTSNGGTEKLLDLSEDIWIAGFLQESEEFVYTGQKITQNFRVYYGDTLLTEKTDYTLTYKNNVNAAAYNSTKAPSVTIKFKGQYSGSRTLYFTIKPRALEESMSYEQVVSYAKTLKIAAPTLYYNNKKLTSNKDFTCDYSALPEEYKKGASYTPGMVYHYKVNGIGNFTGEIQMDMVVLDDKNHNMSSATVTLDQKQYQYHGVPLTTADVGITSVKFGKNAPLNRSFYEYKVYANGVGTGYIELRPSEAGRDEGYRGMKKINIKVVGDRKIQDAQTANGWQETIIFSQKKVNDDGGMIQAKEGVLVYDGEDVSEPVPLEEGKDYTVKYSSHKKVGNATATFTGIGRYTGKLKVRYAITPNISEENFTIIWKKNVKKVKTDEGEIYATAYQKGGASPDFVLMDQDENILKNKTDYTVKLSNNKTVGLPMTCVITGKGNYKGYSVTKEIMVTLADIGQGTMTVSDKPVSSKANAWKSTPTIKDVNGKKLAARKDYSVEFEYTDKNGEIVSNPVADTEITITVHGINNYEGTSITGTYRIYQTSISKLKITIDAQEYTGKEITLTPRVDIHAYKNSSDQKKKIEIWDECYEIAEYKNNIKAGTAKVTLRGIGEYGGTKTYSFKISKKVYLTNLVKKITLDKTSMVLSLQGDNTEKLKLTATITAADDKNLLTNSTVIWSTSNSKVADVKGGETVEKKQSGAYERTSTAQITLIKEGSVTITATTQDGNKKAKCTLVIADVPVIKGVDQPIVMKKDDTYRLTFENYEDSQKPDMNGATWSNSNSGVVSFDKENFVLTAKKTGYTIIKLTKGSKYVQQFYVLVEEDNVPTEDDGYYVFEQKLSSADDTNDIKNAISSAYNAKDGDAYKYDGIYIPAGVYWIDAMKNYKYGIFLDGRNNGYGNMTYRGTAFEIRFSAAALIQTIGNSEKIECHVIGMEQCQNITITGGTLIGERKSHKGTGGEAGHGIGIYDSSNITISDMDISQCWGDGIYLGRFSGSTIDNKKITIENCNVHDNRRNNLSITSADGVTIDNCQFNYAKGTDPQFGIDIETNTSRACKNITISNTTIKGNAKGSVGIMTKAENVTLKKCTLGGNFYNWAGKNVVLQDVKFLSGGVINNDGYTTTIK